MRYTDLADELYHAPEDALPAGVRVATAKRGGVTVTRVEIAREGLERPRGRYVTLEVPRVSLLDERDESVIEPAAAELRALLPAAGPVLVLGAGNRRITADALGPRTVQKIFVTMGQRSGGSACKQFIGHIGHAHGFPLSFRSLAGFGAQNGPSGTKSMGKTKFLIQKSKKRLRWYGKYGIIRCAVIGSQGGGTNA